MKKSVSLLLSLLLIIGSFAGVCTANVTAESEYIYLKQGEDFTFTHFANNGFTPITNDEGVQTGLSFDPAGATDSSVRSYAAFGFTDSNTFSNLMGKTLCFAMDITVSSQTVDGAGDQSSMYMLLTGSADRSGSAVKDKVWSDRMYNVGWITLGVTRRISFIFTPETTTDFNYINLTYNGVGTFKLSNITISEYAYSASAGSADKTMGTASVSATTYASSVGTAPEGKFAIGEKVTYSATANDGYTFDSWKDADGNTVSNAPLYVTPLTSDNLSLTASFIPTSGYTVWRQGDGNTFSHTRNGGSYAKDDKSVLFYDPTTRTDLAYVCLWGDDAHKITALVGKTVRLSMDITVISGADENTGIEVVGTSDRGATSVYWAEHMYNIGYIEDGTTTTICTTFTVQDIGTANYIQFTCKSNSKFEIRNITLSELAGTVTAASADENMGTVTASNTTAYQGGISGWTSKNHYPYLKDAQEYAIGETATFTATEKDGYIFENWTDSDGKVVSTLSTYETVVTGDIKLTANFKETEKTNISFETFGGTAIEAIVGEVGKSVNTPTAVKAGFYFDGWYTNKACTSAFDGITPEEDITLYAKWGKGYVQNFENENTVSKNGGMLLTSDTNGDAYSGDTVLEYDSQKADSTNISKNRVIVNAAGSDIPLTSALGTDGVFELSFKYRVLKGSVKFTICCGTSNISAVPTGWYDSNVTLTQNSDWQEFSTTITVTKSDENDVQDYINIWIGLPDNVTEGQIYIDDVVVNPINKNLTTAYNSAAALRSASASSTGKNGLRIYNEIQKEWIESNNIVEFGSVATRTSRLGGNELTVGAEGTVKGVAFNANGAKLWKETDSSYVFTSYLTNISDKHFGETYSIRTYALDADGNYYYGSICEVSVFQIANAIDNGNSVSGTVSDADKEAFKTFVTNENLNSYSEWCKDYGNTVGDIFIEVSMVFNVADTDMTAKTLALSDQTSVSANIKQNGRTLVDESGITVEWTCSGFTFSGIFSGNITLDVTASEVLHIFVISDNDVENAARIVIPAGDSTITLASDMKKEYHKFTVEKTSDTGSYFTAKVLNYVGVLADRPADKNLTIEFIGDSVISATSLYTEEVQPEELLRTDTRLGLPSTVARKLGADLSVVSRSGHAINNHSTAGSNRIMDWYNSTLYTNKNSSYQGSADIVVVGLGTNDTPFYLDADKIFYDPNGELVSGIKTLLTEVRTANPNATIVFTYGMMDERIASVYQSAVEDWASANSDINTYYLRLTRGDYCTGAGGHPNPDGHAFNAEKIVSFLKSKGY